MPSDGRHLATDQTALGPADASVETPIGKGRDVLDRAQQTAFLGEALECLIRRTNGKIARHRVAKGL